MIYHFFCLQSKDGNYQEALVLLHTSVVELCDVLVLMNFD